MKNRIKRLSDLRKIPRIAQIDHRHLLDDGGRPIWQKNLSRKERRKLDAGSRKISLMYNKILRELHSSGVGFPVDQMMRQMAIEYTHRYASSGTGNQPISFNYFEPFYNIKLIRGSVAPYVALTPETNHLFSTSDFLEFLTSNDSDGFKLDSIRRLPDAKTYHFTNNGKIDELTFFDASGREYVFSGFSMVRRESSLHWFLLAGEKLTNEEWELRMESTKEIDLENITPWKRAFLKESIERFGASVGAPMKLEGTETSVRTLVAGEFDLNSEKHIGRSIFIETENTFAVFSDDPEILVGLGSEEHRKHAIDNAMKRIAEADILWNLAEGFFQLPQYFETRVTASRELVRKKGKHYSLRGKGGRGISAEYIAVEAVSIEDHEASPVIRQVSMPLYSTETEGHWRRLNYGRTGKDREGNPIQGKTWVARSSPWRDLRARERVVYVKDCLAVAKKRVEELYAASEALDTNGVSQSVGNGQLYVLRCTLMQEELYKVGFTTGTAIERARQLSSATGVPMAYVVVESWTHEDPEALETEVHAQLAPYRVNNQREFFRLGFDDIRKIIVKTIERVSGSVSR